DFLRKKVQTTTNAIGVAAIYCNFKEGQMQTPENLLAGACVQLANTLSGPLPRALVDIYEGHSRLKTRPTSTEVLKVLDSTVHEFDTVYLVIDALDECSEQVRDRFLTQMDALPVNTRRLVTTRHVDSIVNRYYDCPKIEIRATDVDLKNYITSRIASSNRLMRHVREDPVLERAICEKVTSKADGMFLAAKLHVDALSTKGNVKTLKKALENLPTTLDELYDDAVQRIKTQSPDDEHLALKALRWVAYTYRPLGFRALQQALAIETDEDDFDSDGIHPIGLVLDVCAGLLIADVENKIVRLVHYTTQDYLDSLLTSRFQDTNTFIASNCITYLSYDTIQSDDSRVRYTPLGPLNPFFTYASTFWAAHAMARQSSELKTQIERYLASNPWVCLISPADYDGGFLVEHPQRCQGYGVAAFYGLYDELGFLLRDTINIDQLLYDHKYWWRSRVRESALHLAVRNDQIQAVCILLDHGADIEKKNSAGQTPLLLAIQCKALTIARELISRGANVMGEGADLQIPFQKVWWSSPMPFLQYLLAAGTILERQHLFDVSELMTRIVGDNDLQTGQWLFESALQVPDMTPIRSTLLIDAARHGALYLVKKLLDCGADVDSKDQRGRTALHQASAMGKLAVVKRLSERGIDVNIRSDSGQIALHRAAQSGDEELVKALITYDSDIDVHDDAGSTPLIDAIDLNKTSIALQLLQHGADVNVQDDNGMTALHFASARGNLRIVQKLMEQQMSVEYKSLFTLATKFMEPTFGGVVRFSALVGVLNIITCQRVCIKVFAIPKANDRRGLDILKGCLFQRDTFSEWRVWKQGMTALDIAVLHGNKQIISLLATGNESKGQPDATPCDEYLCEMFGLSTIDELIRTLRMKEKSSRYRPAGLGVWQMYPTSHAKDIVQILSYAIGLSPAWSWGGHGTGEGTIVDPSHLGLFTSYKHSAMGDLERKYSPRLRILVLHLSDSDVKLSKFSPIVLELGSGSLSKSAIAEVGIIPLDYCPGWQGKRNCIPTFIFSQIFSVISKTTISQANQLSIATLFGGQTDQSPLLGPPDQGVGSMPASFTLPIRPSARTPAGAQENHTIAGDTSGETATEGAPDHLQTKPLFQSFGRHSPTETELKTAEEIEYNDIARTWGELEEAGTPAAPTSSPSPIQVSDFDNECWEISAGEFMASQANSSPDAQHGMVMDEEIGRFEEGNGYREMTEEEMWAIFNDCDEQEDDKENLAPFNGLVRWKTA
ncbi:MAG: hypothetical protein L6R42_004057, partial [Xanthoria sp. 1 TBL-2021]